MQAARRAHPIVRHRTQRLEAARGLEKRGLALTSGLCQALQRERAALLAFPACQGIPGRRGRGRGLPRGTPAAGSGRAASSRRST